jgi:hypothetical protein
LVEQSLPEESGLPLVGKVLFSRETERERYVSLFKYSERFILFHSPKREKGKKHKRKLVFIFYGEEKA